MPSPRVTDGVPILNVRYTRPRLSSSQRNRDVVVVCALILVAITMIFAGHELSAAIVLFAGLAAPLALRRWEKDPLDPGVMFVIVYGLYAWASAASVAIGDEYDGSVQRVFWVTVLAGELAFLVSYGIAANTPRTSRVIDKLCRIGVSRFLVWSALIALIGYATLFALGGIPGISAVAYTDWAFQSRLDARDSPFGGVWSAMRDIPNELMLLSLVLIASSQRFAWGVRAAAVGGLVFGLTQAVKSGSKFEVLFVVFLFLSNLNYIRKKLRLRHIAAAALLLYPAATMITHVRNTTSLTTMFGTASQLIREDPSILSPHKSGELIGPPLTLMVIIEDIGRGSMTYSLGSTYLDELATWIPRPLWVGRPAPMAEQFMQVYFPKEDSEGKGRGFFILTGGYWAFGIPGAMAEAAACGLVLGWLYSSFRTARRTPVGNILYASLAFWLSLMVIRAGLLNVAKGALMAAAPIVLLVGVLWAATRTINGYRLHAPAPLRRRT